MGMDDNLDPMRQWLAYAPQAIEPLPGKKWHVFLSYRSVYRDWALHLYDALTQTGLKVFLDQFQLVAGASLATSLAESLGESASGVIVWSNESDDSAWCKTEYEAMVNLRNKPGSMFRFVVIKTGTQDLPLFAQNSLYEDFSLSPEGPLGAGLLRVMYGLIDKPMSPEAVRFAAKIDAETKDELIKVRAATDIGDAERLFALGMSRRLAWLTSPVLACKAAEALIGLGARDNALTVLSAAEANFPKSIRPKQLKALALARVGKWAEAQPILAELYAAGHRDPETLGIYARTWMDRYKSSNNRHHLERSRDLYKEAFELSPRDSYTGINAASKSVLLGDLDTARALADKVEAIVGTEKVSGDYWKTATVAEVQLLRGNNRKAADLYKAAVNIEPEAKDSHASTLGQARVLMDKFETPAEERAAIEAAFG